MINNERKLAEKALQALANGDWSGAIDRCHEVFQLEESTVRGLSDNLKSAVLSVKAQALTHLNILSEARRCLNEMYQLDKKNTPQCIALLNQKLEAVFVADGDESPPIKVFISESVKGKGCRATLDVVALAMWSYLGQPDELFPNEDWRRFVSKQDLSALEQDRDTFTLVWAFFQKYAANSQDKQTSVRQRGCGSQNANEYFVRGLTLSEEGQNSKAADAFKQSLESETPLCVSHKVAVQYWVVALYNAERYEEMEEATKHTRLSDPEMRLYHGMAVMGRRRDPHEAERDFQVAQAAKPDDADVAHAIGLAWMKYGDESKAKEQFRRALILRPKFPAALFNLALTCKEHGNPTEAREHLEEFLKAERSGPIAERAKRMLDEL